MTTPKININSIEYKNDQQAEEDFIRILIDYILDNDLFEKGELYEITQ